MKITVLASVLAVFALGGAGCATQKSKTSATTPQRETVVLTGSYLKQDIRRSGMITDGFQNVQVIDSNTVQNSGVTSVSQLLDRTGIH